MKQTKKLNSRYEGKNIQTKKNIKVILYGIVIILFISFLFYCIWYNKKVNYYRTLKCASSENIEYYIESLDITIPIPACSLYENIAGMWAISFYSPLNEEELKQQINNILNSDVFEKYTQNNKVQYYNKIDDYTIVDYYVEPSIFYTHFTFTISP